MLEYIFYHVDEFCKDFEPNYKKKLLKLGCIKRIRRSKMTLSEILTIIIYYQYSGMKNFKTYYLSINPKDYSYLVSYNRFTEIMQQALFPLSVFCKTYLKKQESKITFIDSTCMQVCHNARIPSNKVFKGCAKRGKTSIGWFYGFKLHIIIDRKGNLLNFAFSKGNVPDNNLKIVEDLTNGISGRMFGDKGYISSKLFKMLYKKGITIITKLKSNMQNKLMNIYDKFILTKRPVVESSINIIKTYFDLCSSRSRSISNFFVQALSSIAAYIFKPQKPSITLPEMFIA